MGWWRRLFGGSRAASPAVDAGSDDAWIELPRFAVAPGSRWAGELWDDKPVFAPYRVDVAAFLSRRPMP
jgi:hypothetical protein